MFGSIFSEAPTIVIDQEGKPEDEPVEIQAGLWALNPRGAEIERAVVVAEPEFHAARAGDWEGPASAWEVAARGLLEHQAGRQRQGTNAD